MKGKTFTEADIPRSARAKMSDAEKKEWCAKQTERWKIVAKDGAKPLIAEEIDQVAVNKLSPKGRRAAGFMMRMDKATRAEIIAAFEPDGTLRHPFEKV